MENQPENANQGNPQPDLNAAAQGDPNLNGQGQPGQNQENQAIRAEMQVIRSQLNEITRVISALRDIGPVENNPPIVEVNSSLLPPRARISQALRDVQWPPYGLPLGYTPPAADAQPEGVSSGAPGPDQPNPAVHDVGTMTPRVQIQLPNPANAPVTPTGTNSPVTAHPQAQHLVPQATAYPHLTPAVVSMNNSQYGGYLQNYPNETRSQFQMLEERLRAVEGFNFRSRSAQEMCLVPNLVLPPKFKPPVFDKYKGATCPRNHVVMYCRKMTAHAHDDNLMIHFFQESLTGASLDWYMKLEPTHIRCWKDLADAFIRQYQYNSDLAPDRTQLQCMSKKDNEPLKEYAQRWRALAAQVTPPLLDKELITMFMETLPPWLFKHLVGSAASTFSEVVDTAERIENAVRSGRLAQDPTPPSNPKKPHFGSHKKKEGETNAIISASGPSHDNSPQAIPALPQVPPAQFAPPPQYNNQYRNYGERKTVTFDPIPMSYTDLFNYLIANKLISTRPMRPYQPPYPRGYDANATCAFHAGAVGHVVENCKAFKYVVQDLLDAKSISFQNPNVTTNPLPGHGGPSANAIDDQGGECLIRKVEQIKTPLAVVYNELCQLGVVKRGFCRENGCADAVCEGGCETFKAILQDLMDRCVVQVGTLVEDRLLTLCSDKNKGMTVPPKKECWDTLGEPSGKFDYLVRYDAPESAKINIEDIQPSGWGDEDEISIVHSVNGIFSRTIEIPCSPSLAVARPHPIVIPVPVTTPDRETRIIPWSCNVQVHAEIPKDIVDVTNIAGSSGITRSGRLYAPENLRKETPKDAEERARKGKGTVEIREVSDKEAQEFLKVMRQSEYKIVDQLNQTPSKISMLSLLLSSEAHRAALLKVLNEAHVSHDITVNQLDGIVGNIVASNYLTFTNAELPPVGKNHNKALNISIKIGDYILARVLIDNGSSLNVMPKTTMDKLNVDCSYLKPSTTLVRAFDGSIKEVFGEVEMPIQVGPEEFYVTFQVMDISSSYSCLLGRPWIHAAGAVPSTLHQKIKFVARGKLIVVSGEEETLISKSPPEYYVEAAEESFETAFQGLEIANAVESEPLLEPRWSKTDMVVAKIMLGHGYQIGRGLGKNAQGIAAPVQLRGNPDKFGLGYIPSLDDREELAADRREKWLLKLGGKTLSQRKMIMGDLSQNFISAGVLYPDQVNMVEKDSSASDGAANLVRRCVAGEEMQNWESMDFPVISNLE